MKEKTENIKIKDKKTNRMNKIPIRVTQFKTIA